MWVQRASVAVALTAIGIAALPGIANADPTLPGPTPPGPTAPAPTAPASTGPALPGPATPAPPGSSGPKTVIDADGTYAVGTDIVPGVYSSAGPFAGGTCSWRRTGNPDGATIDNALTHKPQIVQIDPTDKAFKTTGCQAWQLTDGATPDTAAVSPVIAGLQLGSMLAQLQGRAAASGQLPPP